MISKIKIVLFVFLWPVLVNAQSFSISGQTFLSVTTTFNPWATFKIEKTGGIKLGTEYNFYDNFSLRAQFYYLDGTLTSERLNANFIGDLNEYSIELGLVWKANSAVITPMISAGAKYNTYKRSIDKYDYYEVIYGAFLVPGELSNISESLKSVITPYVSLGLKVNLFDNVFYLFEMEFSRDIFDISRSYTSATYNTPYNYSYRQDYNRLKYGIGIGVSF